MNVDIAVSEFPVGEETAGVRRPARTANVWLERAVNECKRETLLAGLWVIGGTAPKVDLSMTIMLLEPRYGRRGQVSYSPLVQNEHLEFSNAPARRRE